MISGCFRLIAAGITTDKIASRSIFLTPLQIILPWLLGKQTAGPKPLNVFLWAYPYRIVMGIVFAALVYWTPSFRESNGEYPYLYYVIWIGAYYLQQVSSKKKRLGRLYGLSESHPLTV